MNERLPVGRSGAIKQNWSSTAHLHSPDYSAKSETVNQTLGEPIKRKLRRAETALGTHGRSRVANARLRPNRRYVGYRTEHSHD
jgi:hypothetical protein